MIRRSVLTGGVCCLFFLFGSSAGQSASGWQSLSGVIDSVRLTGWGAVEMGQVVRGTYDDGNGGEPLMLHRWIQKMTTLVGAEAKVNERMNLSLGVQFAYQFNTAFPAYSALLWEGAITYRSCFWLDRLYMDYQVLNGEYPLKLQIGYFPFNYNDAVTNLGAYLFRTESYPTCIYTSFDFTDSRLLGLNLESTLFGVLRQNLLFTSEAERYPTQDFSLSYLVSASFLNKAVDIGGGVCAHRLFAVDPKRTSPKTLRGQATVETISKIENGDTTFYTFAGTKVMARATLDPKALLPSDISDIFGKEDLKLYFEGAILGVKDWPSYDTTASRTAHYDVRSERTVGMVGLHLPTFKIFDVLAVEVEYFPSRYYSNFQYTVLKQLPLPVLPAYGVVDTTNAHRLKWSVYGSKKLGNNLRFVFQVARDHNRVTNSADDPKILYYADNFVNAREWYYIGKVVFGF